MFVKVEGDCWRKGNESGWTRSSLSYTSLASSELALDTLSVLLRTSYTQYQVLICLNRCLLLLFPHLRPLHRHFLSTKALPRPRNEEQHRLLRRSNRRNELDWPLEPTKRPKFRISTNTNSTLPMDQSSTSKISWIASWRNPGTTNYSRSMAVSSCFSPGKRCREHKTHQKRRMSSAGYQPTLKMYGKEITQSRKIAGTLSDLPFEFSVCRK